MNERIYALATEAGAYCETYLYGGDPKLPVLDGMDLEKFAELIVRECANFLKDTLDDHFAAEQLEEHFGVR